MAEHAKRYEDFAKFLNKNGYIVFADDHRAHGKTARGEENLGIYKDGGPDVVWDTIMDEIYFSRRLIEKNKLPLYVLGHSYGSFICQAYIQKCNLYTKAIMCGSACMKNRIDVKLGKMIAKSISKRKGHDAPAEVIRNLTFGMYNKKFKPNKTDYDWLCSDEEALDEYINDELVGKNMTVGLFRELLDGMKFTCDKKNNRKVDYTKPILLLSGEKDSVGKNGKGIDKVYKLYKSVGVQDVSVKVYDGLRHDILHEKNHFSIFEDIYNWMKARRLIMDSKKVIKDEVRAVKAAIKQKKSEKTLADSKSVKSILSKE